MSSKQELLVPPKISELPESEVQLILAKHELILASEWYVVGAGFNPIVNAKLIGYCFDEKRQKVTPVYRTTNGIFSVEHDKDENGVMSMRVEENKVYLIN